MALDFSKSKNANKLKEIQKNSVKNSNRMTVIDIPLEEIDINPDNAEIFNMDKIDFLAKSIKEDGLNTPISVFKKPDGRYEISSGHRRFEAVKQLGWAKISCTVSEMPTDYERGKALLITNVKNRVLTPMDMARAIAYYQKLLESSGKKKGDFIQLAADFFGISYTQVYRYQVLLRIIPNLQNLADMEGFPYSSLREAVSLSEDGQNELYRQLTVLLDESKDEEENRELKLTRARIEQIIHTIREKEEYQARPELEKRKKEKRIAEDESNISSLNEEIAGDESIQSLEDYYERPLGNVSSHSNNDVVFEQEIDEQNVPTDKYIKSNKDEVSEFLSHLNKLEEIAENIKQSPNNKDIVPQFIERLENVLRLLNQ